MTQQSARLLDPTEEESQVALFRWASMAQVMIPALRMLFAVPNGMHSNPRHVKRMKAAGLRPGVPDVWLPVASQGFHGLVVEMKSKNGRTSKEQVSWISALNEHGYKACVCRGFEEAKAVILEYLNG